MRAQSKLDIARVNLEQVMGVIPNDGEYSLDEESIELDSLYARVKPLPNSLSELKDEAIHNRPELLANTARIQSAQSDVKSVNGEYFPSVKAKGDYQYNGSDLAIMYDHEWSAGVVADWEFFSGFKTDAKSEEARSNVLRYEAEKQKIRLKIINEVTNAYNLAKLYREAIELQIIAVKLGSENLQLAEERYKSGISDMIELNDAQVKYTQAKTDFVVSYYDYNIALANIDHAIAKTIQ
jgi:outer membrane protein